MKIKKLIKFITIFLAAGLIFTTLAPAQEGAGGTEVPTRDRNQAERPEDNYLARFNARNVVNNLMESNLEKIFLINVIQSNFPGKGWEGTLNNLYDDYKTAMEFYYKRQLVDARVKFEENAKDINDLLRVIALDYQEETAAILDEAASKILDLHLDSAVRAHPDIRFELHQNQMRLRVAYGQLDQGMNAIMRHRYQNAIYFLRSAKVYGIRIHEMIPETDQIVLPGDDAETIRQKQQAVREKYQVHKADNLNRIFNTD